MSREIESHESVSFFYPRTIARRLSIYNRRWINVGEKRQEDEGGSDDVHHRVSTRIHTDQLNNNFTTNSAHISHESWAQKEWNMRTRTRWSEWNSFSVVQTSCKQPWPELMCVVFLLFHGNEHSRLPSSVYRVKRYFHFCVYMQFSDNFPLFSAPLSELFIHARAMMMMMMSVEGPQGWKRWALFPVSIFCLRWSDSCMQHIKSLTTPRWTLCRWVTMLCELKREWQSAVLPWIYFKLDSDLLNKSSSL